MKKYPTIIRSFVRPLILIALLLTVAVAGLQYGGAGFWHNSVSAQATVSVVNAASFDQGKILTPDTIGAAFGSFVTTNNQTFVAQTTPLPTTLGGIRVRVGNNDAGLFFSAPTQINFVVPTNTADGANVQITVTNSDNSTRTGTFTVVRAAPGVFTAKADGTGIAAAVTTFDGAVYQPVIKPDGSPNDVDPGTSQRPNVLVLYATGVRYTPAPNPTDNDGVAESVSVKMDGVPCPLLYAGPAPGFVGLDQLNPIIPPELAGSGLVSITVTAGGRTSNPIQIKLAGQVPAVRATPVTFGQMLEGELTATDQIQRGTGGRTYFFDAFSFDTTAANASVAIDLRATPATAFDAAVLLYRVDRVGNADTLTLVGADDQSNGYGNGNIDNNNALLFMVLPTAGKYVAFATSSDSQPDAVGRYTIRFLNNVATQIAYGQAVPSPAINTTDLQTSAGTYLDLYWFTGATNDNVRITMGSTAFDSFVILQGNDGDPPFGDDDNGGGGQNSQLTKLLPNSGIFIIIATPYEPNKTGAYTFSLTRLSGFEAESQPFNLFKVPGREIIDRRPSMSGEHRSTFERNGSRRVVERSNP